MALAQKLKDPKWRREVEKQIKNRQITHGRRGHAASAKYTDWTARWAGHYQKGSGPRPARKLRSLSEMSASEYMFDHQGQQKSVQQFFEEKYGMKLRFPDLPCLCFGAQGKNAVPMELCEFGGGEPAGIDSQPDRDAVIKHTSGQARERLQKVEGFAREVKAEASASGSTASAFGISVGDPMVVMGRELQMMGLEYGDRGVARPKQHDGSWFADAGGRKFRFARASQVDRVFVVLCAEGQDPARFLPWQALQTWQKTIETEARTRGVRFPQFPEQPIVHTGGKIETTLNRELGPMSLTERDLVCCILPDKKDRREHDIYESIKRWMHSTGVPTQCTQAPKAQRVGKGYDSNMLHKMNLKMGGANWKADRGGLGLLRDATGIGSPGTIVFGCDVHHPKPGSDRPSFAALVASMDMFDYAEHLTLVQKQPTRMEVVIRLQAMVEETLRRWRDKNGTPPRRIIFYRDGVAHSQFKMVHDHEVAAIERACEAIGLTAQIVFIVVQKRNHARFFNTRQQKDWNPTPGTVIDDAGVVSSVMFDFYLVSHWALKGTARPTHYHVLRNDANLDADQVQKFTFELCHMYGRSTKIVSQPAPTYYADLAAEQAPFLMKDFQESGGSWEVSSATGTHASGASAEFVEVSTSLQNRLFFA